MADQDEIDYGQPVDEGDELVVTIDDIGSKGDGIARVDGFVVFVPDTEVGETVKIEIDTVGRKFAFATVMERDVEQEESEDAGGIEEGEDPVESEAELGGETDFEDVGEEISVEDYEDRNDKETGEREDGDKEEVDGL